MHRCAVESCGTTVGPDRMLCARHVENLEREIGDIPALADALEGVIARVPGGNRGRNGARSAEIPLPFDEDASKARGVLVSTLSAWCAEIGATPISIPTAARMLLRGFATLIVHPEAGEAYDEITAATGHAWHAVDNKVERVYAGPCECGHDLLARVGRASVECRRCKAVHDVDARLEHMRAELDGMPLTVRQIAVFAAWLGKHPDTKRTETKLNVWAHRGKIEAYGRDLAGRPTYAFGEVVRKLDEGTERKSDRAV